MKYKISVSCRNSPVYSDGTKIIEFCGQFADRSGLISIRENADRLVVDVYRLDQEVEVRVARDRIHWERRMVNFDARTGDCIRYLDTNWMVDETYPNRCVIFSAQANCERQLIDYSLLYEGGAYYLE